MNLRRGAIARQTGCAAGAWIPNAITVARMLLAPPLAWAILADRPGLALLLAFVAGSSDALDGWLAKHFHWQSWWGSILDPLADKLMLTAAFLVLAIDGALPWWFLALVLGRDIAIVLGALVYHYRVARLEAAPSWWSKWTTVMQILLVLSILSDRLLPRVELHVLSQGLIWASVVLTVVSGANYIFVWSRRAWQAK